MALWFSVIALVLVTFGGLTAAIDAAYSSLSRNDVAGLGEGTARSKTFHVIAEDIPAHLNAINFVRVLCETFAAILVSLAFVSLGFDLVQVLLASAATMAVITFVLVGSSPRSVGRAHPLVIVEWTGWLVRGFRVVLGPITVALVGIGNAVTPGRARTSVNTERQLLSLVDEATESDAIEEEDRDLIRSIFDFGDTIVREVMVARTEMVTLDATDSIDAALTTFLAEGFSRMPVIGENSDDIRGIAYLKDVIRHVRRDAEAAATTPVTAILRPALFIPEVKKADEALRELQERANHMAIVVDEYGGIAGLVTMEDLIEEVVGEIADEYDDDQNDFTAVGDGSIRVLASTNIDALAEHLDLTIVEDDVDTVGGLFVKNLGRLPATGDSVHAHGLLIVAERV
ncbi:MAG: hemolysin family protein, partial [Microbacteriaceae bacterium]